MTEPRIPSDAVSPAATRVFLALLAEYETTGRATVRAVAKRSHRSIAIVHRHLTALRTAGLVDWEDDHAATLRPVLGPAMLVRR